MYNSDPKIKCQMNGHKPMMSQTSWKTCRVEKESMNRDYKQPQAADGPTPIPEQHPPDTAEEGLLLHAVRWRWLLNRKNKCFNSNAAWSSPAGARGFTSTCVLINGIKKNISHKCAGQHFDEFEQINSKSSRNDLQPEIKLRSFFFFFS